MIDYTFIIFSFAWFMFLYSAEQSRTQKIPKGVSDVLLMRSKSQKCKSRYIGNIVKKSKGYQTTPHVMERREEKLAFELSFITF